MAHQSSIKDLLAEATAHAPALCLHLFPAGRFISQGKLFAVGDVSGAKATKAGSLRVHLVGPRAGWWADWHMGECGDLIDLVRAVPQTRCQNKTDAIKWLRNFLQQPPAPPTSFQPAAAGGTTSPEKLRRIAYWLWKQSEPIAGTPSDTYLRTVRGIDPAHLECLGHHGGMMHPDMDPEARIAALTVRLVHADGKFAGIHRIYPGAPAGSEKRVALGPVWGAAARLTRGSLQTLVAAEAVEDGAAIATACRGATVWAAPSATLLGAMEIPKTTKRLIVASDADDAGDKAFAKLQERLAGSDVDVIRARPQRKDWNDVLLIDGADAVRAAFAQWL